MATGELSNVWEKKLRSVLETSCSLPRQTYSNIRLCHICPPRTAFTHVRHSLHFIIIINYNKNCFCVFTQDTNPRKKRAQSKHRSPSIYSLATDRKCVKLKLYKLTHHFPIYTLEGCQSTYRQVTALNVCREKSGGCVPVHCGSTCVLIAPLP